jgi:hypothetical protein
MSTRSAIERRDGLVHHFDDPIVLPDGRELVTLPDAGEYVQALPMTTQQRKEWQPGWQERADHDRRGSAYDRNRRP